MFSCVWACTYWGWLLGMSLWLGIHTYMSVAGHLMCVPWGGAGGVSYPLRVILQRVLGGPRANEGLSAPAEGAWGCTAESLCSVILRALRLWSPCPHFCCGTKPGLLTRAQSRLTRRPDSDHVTLVPPGPLISKTAFPLPRLAPKASELLRWSQSRDLAL